MSNVNIKSSEREQRLIAMGEMAATLAHEIRNPLGSMELYCSLLKKDLSTEPTLLNLAEQIHQGIRTLNNIINISLQFSREINPKAKPIENLEEYFNTVISLVQDKIDSLGVKVNLAVENTKVLNTDPYLLKQALVNIIQNAVEAAAETSSSEKAVNINCQVTADETFKITVEDNGQGISEENMSKIFDPFFTTKVGGTGLGLPVSHSIVKSLNGLLTIESVKGTGTKIIIEIKSLIKNTENSSPFLKGVNNAR